VEPAALEAWISLLTAMVARTIVGGPPPLNCGLAGRAGRSCAPAPPPGARFFGGPRPAWNDAPEAVPKTPAQAAPNRRASPEAVAKRRAARLFNEAITGPSPRPGDGRTERRRRRMLQELADGVTRTGHDLKPIDVLLRAQALLDLGEPLASLIAARPAPPMVKTTEALVDGVRRLHAAYAFSPDVYRLVGIDDEALRLAGVRAPKPAGLAKAREGKRGPVKTVARPPAGAPRRGAA
jgi:hypothetical protein